MLARSSLLASFLVHAVSAAFLSALSAACSPLQGAPSGTQCFSAVDCAAGLACVPKAGAGSISVCTSNIKAVETELDSGMEAGPGDTGPVMLADGSLTATPDAPATTDTGSPPPVPDTGAPPPVDAGHPVDTGTPPVDAGHDGGVDAGHEAGVDAGHD